MTSGGLLAARYVIHTVGPIYVIMVGASEVARGLLPKFAPAGR